MTNCCYIEHTDGWDVGHVKIHKARVSHTCGECGATIKPGMHYEVATGCWDGRWDRHKTCARCVNIRDEYFTGGWYYGNVRWDFKDCFGFDYVVDGIPPDFAPCKGVPSG